MRACTTGVPIPARFPASQRKNHGLLLLRRRQCSGDLSGSLLRWLEFQPSILSEAKKLHGVALVNGLLRRGSGDAAAVMASRLAGAYAALGGVREAQLVFPGSATTADWNFVLRRAVEARRFPVALAIFRSMLAAGTPPDGYTYPLLLKSCADSSALERGREIYRSIARPNVFAQCAAVDMFAKCGSMEEARRLFEEMPHRDLVSWTTMICGAMQNGSWSEALTLFMRMRSEGVGFDSVTLATVAPACGRVAAPLLGMALHGGAIAGGVAEDLCVLNSLIDMYCKCGLIRLAEAVFSAMELRDSISWSTLITGYSQNHQHSQSSRLFAAMIAAGARPSSVTLAGALPAFSGLKLLHHGKEIHGYAVRNLFHLDSFVASAMIDLYSHCGALAKAEFVFAGGRGGQDLAVWNSMISGYAMAGDPSSAFESLRALLHAGLRPSSVTVVAVLPLCGRWTMLHRGRELHGYATRSDLLSATIVSNSLIDVYCKCGLLSEGEKLFQRAPRRDAVTFNAMIAALGMHGHGRRAVACFAAMGEEKIEPDKVTFVALLSACSHAGLVDEGLAFFRYMVEDRGIRPEMEHYSCIVDLHGRSGRLDEAWDFIRKMPVEPEIDVLGSLLGACRVHQREDLAELVGGWIMEKEEAVDPGYHLLLANTYAWSGRWSKAAGVRRMVRESGLRKRVPGSSWIQVGAAAHRFSARERSHPLTEEVNETLRSLLCQIKDQGYSLDVGCVPCPSSPSR